MLALEVSRQHRAERRRRGLFQAVRSELARTVGVVPDEIVLVRQNTIPRTSSGKIQRGACRAAFLDEHARGAWAGWQRRASLVRRAG